jgi:hypothetical protein
MIFTKALEIIEDKERHMKPLNESIELIVVEKYEEITGGGFFYELGAFVAQQFNVSDSIYETYGNTNMNHHW